MSVEKVKLPKEVSEAIEELRESNWSNRQIIQKIEGADINSYVIRLTGYVTLYGFDVLLQALVNGYEVEETPEDKVREFFNAFSTPNAEGMYKRNAICKTLDLLNIKIEGVNT